MSFEERNTVIYLIVSGIVAAVFGSRIYAGTLEGAFGGAEGLVTWAQTILWMIPFAIVITIVAVILGQILYGIVTGTRDFETESDERDKQIGLRSLRVTAAVFSMGWLGAIVLLALGNPALAALNLMLFAGWASDVAGNLVKLLLYRLGA